MSKRIAIVANNSSNLLNFRGNLIKNLINKKFEVLVLIPKKDFSIEYEKKILKIGAKVLTIPLERAGINPFKDIVTFFFFKICFKKFKPDIVLSYTVKPIIYSGLAIGKNNKINYFNFNWSRIWIYR